MTGSRAEIEFRSRSHAIEAGIEDSLVAHGARSLPMKAFADMLRLRSAASEAERNAITWEIWDQFVWTKGYTTAYERTKIEVAAWRDALIYEARSDYAKRHGTQRLGQNEIEVREQVLADLPKRMHALAVRAKVRATLTLTADA
jgi:hypothetical protein